MIETLSDCELADIEARRRIFKPYATTMGGAGKSLLPNPPSLIRRYEFRELGPSRVMEVA